MQTLARALRGNEGIGEPLPSVFPSLAKQRWHLRRAQVVMIASAPNVGKSAFALELARRLKLMTLYISADTDQYTMITRTIAGQTGDSIEVIERAIQAGAADYYESFLNDLDDVRFMFDAGPTLEDIDQEICAFNEVYGQPPELIVIDNLINVQCDDADEFRGMRIVEQATHEIARSTGACVVLLHHVTGEFEDGLEPPPRRAINGKITRRIEMIFTLGRSGEWLGVACVKNRSGPADPLAGNAVWFHVDLAHMQFEDPMEKMNG